MKAAPRRVRPGISDKKIRIVGLSSPMRHALAGLAQLGLEPGRPRRAEEVARRGGIPAAALSKIFQRLARRGLLQARRGPGGGYRLARPPERMRLSLVVDAAGGLEGRRGRCLLEERPCGGRRRCALHGPGQTAERRLRRALERLSVADLARPGG